MAAASVYRDTLSDALSRVPTIAVVGAGGRRGAAATARARRADVVALEFVFPGALAAVRDVQRAAPETRVVVFAVPDEAIRAIQWADAGVTAALPARSTFRELVAAIAHAARSLEAAAGDREAALTSREEQVFALIEDGRSNKEIARLLDIRLSTVKNHVHSILRKSQASCRTEAVSLTRARRAEPRYRN